MKTSTQTIPTQTPKLISSAVLMLSVLTGASTLPWMYMGAFKFSGFAWGLFGFELVLMLGCLMTALVTLGKVRVGMALPMAIACLMGTILVGAVFGIHVDARALIGDDPALQPWVGRTLLFRLFIIALLGTVATLDVYRRDARSWGLVIRAMLFAAPVFAVLGWIKFKGMPGAGGAGNPDAIAMVMILLGGLFVGIFASVAGHFLIRSFEIALPEAEQD